jgi:hypothetical protein
MESKSLKEKARYDYEVPLRFFVPICNNVDKENLKLDKKTILSYLEFSDYYDQNYYTDTEATAKYMKKWREEGCPDIYKISIDEESHEITKEVIFKRNEIKVKNIHL